MSAIMTRSAFEFWHKKPLPNHIAYLFKDMGDEEWQEVTYKSILDEKRKNQQCELRIKQSYIKTVPAYVWVFHNNTTFFGGWYIYIKTLKHDYGINFRSEHNGELVEKAMQLFPMGILPLEENFDAWAEKFSQQYHHKGFHRKKNQGIAPIYAKISGYGKLLDVFSPPSKS